MTRSVRIDADVPRGLSYIRTHGPTKDVVAVVTFTESQLQDYAEWFGEHDEFRRELELSLAGIAEELQEEA